MKFSLDQKVKVHKAGALALVIALMTVATVLLVLLIKPFEIKVSMVVIGQSYQPMTIYHAGKIPEFKEDEFQMTAMAESSLTEGLSKVEHEAKIRSALPIHHVRIDPFTKSGEVLLFEEVKMGAIDYDYTLSANLLMAQASKGNQLAVIEANEAGVKLSSLGEDPHFQLRIDKALVQEAMWLYIFRVAAILFFVASMMYAVFQIVENSTAIGAMFYEFYASSIGRNATRTVSSIAGFLLLAFAVYQLMAMHTWWSVERVKQAFVADGVGDSVPAEVKTMKELITKHNVQEYDLLGDLGQGKHYNVVYQRATEYLYPVRVKEGVSNKFIKTEFIASTLSAGCQEQDRKDGISLLLCR